MTDNEYSALIKGFELLDSQLNESIKANFYNESRYGELCAMKKNAKNLKLKLCTQWHMVLSGR